MDAKGTVVGTGSHTYDGVKHAEILALEQAGEKARGATLYVNLEPCSHQGRTGPCADAVIAAGISRVVACMQDPNPLVSGQGFAKLRSAGITVSSGVFEEQAKALNESFAKYIRRRRSAGHAKGCHDARRQNRAASNSIVQSRSTDGGRHKSFRLDHR